MAEWWRPSPTSGDILAKPWLHPDVTAYLEKLLSPDMTVLEHGSGGSTLWLAERVKKVVAIETKREWHKLIAKLAPSNARLILWDRGNYPRLSPSAKLPRQFDLFLIDGEPVEDRARFLMDVERFVKPGGIVVLDNANRPEYQIERLKFMKKAEPVQFFNRNVPGRTSYLVTEFYRLEME